VKAHGIKASPIFDFGMMNATKDFRCPDTFGNARVAGVDQTHNAASFCT